MLDTLVSSVDEHANRRACIICRATTNPISASPPRPSLLYLPQEQVVDFEGDDDEEEDEEDEDSDSGKGTERTAASASTSAGPVAGASAAPRGPEEVRVVGPWIAPPDTQDAARIRLSLYFALCVKSRPMFSGLLEAYVTAAPTAQAGLMAELPLLARAAAKGFGEAGVVGLVASAPDGARELVLAVLDLLVPREINKPSKELVAAVTKLRVTRLAAADRAAAMKKEREEEGCGGRGEKKSGVKVRIRGCCALGHTGEVFHCSVFVLSCCVLLCSVLFCCMVLCCCGGKGS